MTLAIRPARPGDGPLVLQFLRELAEYERLLAHVDATAEMIEAAMFGSTPSVHGEIAEWHGAPAGFALWFMTFNTFKCRPSLWLEDIFVRPDFRGHGIGKALIAHCARRCVEQGGMQMQWVVLDWNAPAIGFYEKLGAELTPEWQMTRLGGGALLRLAETQ